MRTQADHSPDGAFSAIASVGEGIASDIVGVATEIGCDLGIGDVSPRLDRSRGWLDVCWQRSMTNTSQLVYRRNINCRHLRSNLKLMRCHLGQSKLHLVRILLHARRGLRFDDLRVFFFLICIQRKSNGLFLLREPDADVLVLYTFLFVLPVGRGTRLFFFATEHGTIICRGLLFRTSLCGRSRVDGALLIASTFSKHREHRSRRQRRDRRWG